MYGRRRETKTIETDAVECTHCGSRMRASPAAGGGSYYACPRCARTYASSYDEAIRKAAGVRRAPSAESLRRDEGFAEVKRRLEAWLKRLDEQDPYFVLGIPPGSSMEQVRSRYRELALEHHPDRGGDEAQMRRILRAYDRVRVLQATGSVARAEPRRIAAAVNDDEI